MTGKDSRERDLKPVSQITLDILVHKGSVFIYGHRLIEASKEHAF